MAGIHEAHQTVWATIGFVHGVPQHAVIAPAVRAGERVDRHHLDEIHAELDQVVELVDRRVESAGRGEGSDVQLVDHRALRRAAGPAGVGRRRALPQLRALVHSLGLTGGPRVGQWCRVVVEQESVARVGGDVGGGSPPPVLAADHRRYRAVDVEAHGVRFRRPDREFRHRRAPAVPPAVRRTTRQPAPSRAPHRRSARWSRRRPAA